MSKPEPINLLVPIDEAFFDDGHCAVLLSQSLGGSGMDPHVLAGQLGCGDAGDMQALLSQGICLPIFFGCDCALDGQTLFVIGELDRRLEQAWIARMTSKLAIPCGKLVLLAGGGCGDEMARAISGTPSDPQYCIYQTIDVPPGNYRVDVLAYIGSPSVAFLFEELDDEEIREKYRDLPEVEQGYVVHLTPLEQDLPLPVLVDEVGWPGVFELR